MDKVICAVGGHVRLQPRYERTDSIFAHVVPFDIPFQQSHEQPIAGTLSLELTKCEPECEEEEVQ